MLFLYGYETYVYVCLSTSGSTALEGQNCIYGFHLPLANSGFILDMCSMRRNDCNIDWLGDEQRSKQHICLQEKKATTMQPTDMSKAHSWGHLCQCSGNIIPLLNDSLSLEGYDILTRMLIAFKS